jgi:hypothetical protein
MIIDVKGEIKKKYIRYNIDSLRNILKKFSAGSEESVVINYIILQRQNRLAEYYSRESKLQLERERQKELDKKKIYFGHKNESYMTEEEMINGSQCSYEDLSISEKLMYSRNESNR